MFERGLFIDGDWISNGEAFWQVPGPVKEKKFIERFIADQDEAIELYRKSEPFLFDGIYKCLLFSTDKEFVIVQVRNLEAIGVNLNMLDEYYFSINLTTSVIYVYDPDFLGGVLPLSADHDKLWYLTLI